MKIIFSTLFGENVNSFNKLFCLRSRCAAQEDEAQLSTSNKDSVGYGSRNKEGRGNTKDDDTEEIIENEGLNAFRKGHESTDDCSLRQNLQSEISGNEGQEKKRQMSSARKKNFWYNIPRA